MKDALQDFYLVHTNVLRNTFEIARKSKEHEAIHNMRLSIKRMRVFFAFIGSWDGKILSKAVPFLDEAEIVFRFSGRYRDVYLQQEALGKTELSMGRPYPEYHRFLELMAKRRLIKLQKTLQNTDLIELIPDPMLISRQLETLSERGLQRSLRLFADLMYGDFMHHIHLWEDDGDPEHMHKARRHLKGLMYLLNMSGVSKLKIQSRIRTARGMKHTEQAIGKWHDRQAALEQFMKFLKKAPPPPKRMKEYELLEDRLSRLNERDLALAERAARKVIRRYC